jgi:hypothetical protein
MTGPENASSQTDNDAEKDTSHLRRRRSRIVGLAAVAVGAVVASQLTAGPAVSSVSSTDSSSQASDQVVAQGKQTFRFDTFGDQAFWGDTLHLNQALAGADNGGVGPGVSPRTALAVGLKVDVNALPAAVRAAISAGQVNLDDPAVTMTLLKLNSVVGVKGIFDATGKLSSVGIECALCHSSVDNSLAPGIGKRLDGWANRDLNVGAIVGLSPNLTPVANLLHTDVATVKTVLGSWGPGKFDAELFLDGKAFKPDGSAAANLIPPAFGLAGVSPNTYTGWGSIPYWNAFVAVLEMHGQGNFTDPRLDNAAQFPIAAENHFGHTVVANDLVTSKLPALKAYQLSLKAPKAIKGTFDPMAADRGKKLFNARAECSTCHVPPTLSEPKLHPGSDIGIDSFAADRSPTHMYRTSPLAGLATHQKGGFYHDGRFPDLPSVVAHYNATFKLHLTAAQQKDLVQYLLSL